MPPTTPQLPPKKRRFVPKGFTLLELLVSLTVLSLLLVLVFSMLDKTQQTWSNAESKVSQFREARNAFELVTRTVSQAVLNTYFNYDNPNAPTDYVRYSELHFVSGHMDDLKISGLDGHGIFFQAPLGFSISESEYDFSSLLNSCGYFLEFNDDGDYKPAFVKKISPDRNRVRLMEFRPPAEDMNVYRTLQGKYGSTSATSTSSWYSTQIRDKDYVRPVAENIVALVFRPLQSLGDGNDVTDIAPNYKYDTRAWQSGGSGGEAKFQKNQLPPLIEITMVAVSERSMIRYQQMKDEGDPKWASGLFKGSAKQSSYDSDLETLKTKLTSDKMSYRIFKETVAIRAAKWSDSKLDN